jgi:hypothetical protein
LFEQIEEKQENLITAVITETQSKEVQIQKTGLAIDTTIIFSLYK